MKPGVPNPLNELKSVARMDAGRQTHKSSVVGSGTRLDRESIDPSLTCPAPASPVNSASAQPCGVHLNDSPIKLLMAGAPLPPPWPPNPSLCSQGAERRSRRRDDGPTARS